MSDCDVQEMDRLRAENEKLRREVDEAEYDRDEFSMDLVDTVAKNKALLIALEEIARFGNSLSGKESAKRAENAIASAMQGEFDTATDKPAEGQVDMLLGFYELADQTGKE